MGESRPGGAGSQTPEKRIMTTRSLAVLFAGAIALAGAAFVAPASAAPLPPVSASPALAQDLATSGLDLRGDNAIVQKAHYYGRRYGPRPYYGPRRYYGPRYGHYGPRPYYGPRYGYYGAPRCRVTRVYTGYGYRTVRRCW
jgi:hypothetical protein